MSLPSKPFIALYGSHLGDWRAPLVARLAREGIAYHDPTDAGWQPINEHHGDAEQATIDALVAREHQGMVDATCVVFYLARRARRRGPDGEDVELTTLSFASRCELGFLTGRGVLTFVYIEPDFEGRNYLWAQIKPYPNVVRCASLDDALDRAIAAFRALQP